MSTRANQAAAARSAPPSAAAELTAGRIVDTCEALIRRHGPAKATVVDVARALGMSHANVYRHFPSKAALREAVVERWLHQVSVPIEAVAASPAPPPERLAAWLRALSAAKRERALADPELFAAYRALTAEQQGAVERHVASLLAQLSDIVSDGIRTGDFAPRDPQKTARALLEATSAFHHPLRVVETAAQPDVEAQLDAVIAILLAGLRAPDATKTADA
jgi:AcrR family transcriptional regulator